VVDIVVGGNEKGAEVRLDFEVEVRLTWNLMRGRDEGLMRDWLLDSMQIYF